MKALFFLTAILTVTSVQAKDLGKDLDDLGGNRALMERANAIDPHNSTRIVQKRLVDRDLRLEMDLTYGIVAGGDPYVNTNNLGVQTEFHIDPHWSIGARYYQSANSLNSEGTRVMDQANSLRAQGIDAPRPSIDYAKDTLLGTVTFYPFYGKINFADLAVAQFDIYFVGGYGKINLANTSVPTYTGGMGFAFWWSQHFSTRLEARFQGYNDQLSDGTNRKMDLTIMSLGIGFLL
jgi:outer membrane beta-barrel protein